MHGRRGLTSRQPSGRLPAIAPRDEQQASSSSVAQGTSLASSIVPDLPRTRLPPRSRSGCWTCRTRKVKCDEAKPKCNQCARLGHPCDYSSRLAFKDETSKYVGRFLGAAEAKSHTWHPASTLLVGDKIKPSPEEDELPPFSLLTTDEDRQQKADYRPPGTYYVVVNPPSFVGLEEYRIADDESALIPAVSATGLVQAQYRTYEECGPATQTAPASSLPQAQYSDGRFEGASVPTSQARSLLRTQISTDSDQSHGSGSHTVVDPNVVILRKFEDVARKIPLLSSGTTRSSGFEDLSPPASASAGFTRRPEDLRISHEPLRLQPQLDLNAERGRDQRLEIHYRIFVRRHLLQIHRDPGNSPAQVNPVLVEDFFEQQAAIFPPLFHALMALSALSLAHRDGAQNVDALQHYQQALTPLQNNLRSPQDLASDGAFLTHFVLLLYEIAAAEPGGTDLWSQQHLAHLLRIAEIRRDVYSIESYPFITWLVCMIDIYAVLSGSGTGEFVETMLKRNLIPNAIDHLPPVGLTGPSTMYADEVDTMPQALEFNRAISILAARFGHLARRIRQGLAQRIHAAQPMTTSGHLEILRRQRRNEELQHELRRVWNTQMPTALTAGYRDANLPERVRGVFEHSYALYRTCLIYSQTSMWATQCMDTGPVNDLEVSRSASEILQLATDIITRRQLERRFIVFPIFMAGFAAKSASDKMLALESLTALERESIGRNTRATKELLQAVYEKQNARLMRVGHSMDVDWIQVMNERGLQVVHFGL